MTIVVGKVEMSNGDSPDLLLVVMGNMRDLNLDYVFRIVGKQINVEFKELPGSFDIDQIFRIARQITDMVVMPLIINNGIALNYRITACWTPDGEYHSIENDETPIGADFNTDALSIKIALHPQLRQAVRDFNQGLMSREDSPLYFYRAVEAMVSLICAADIQPDDDDWRRFHELTGTDAADVSFISDRVKKQQAGTHTLENDEHLKLMALTQRFINKALEFIMDSANMNQ